jgi:hypothetical protein
MSAIRPRGVTGVATGDARSTFSGGGHSAVRRRHTLRCRGRRGSAAYLAVGVERITRSHYGSSVRSFEGVGVAAARAQAEARLEAKLWATADALGGSTDASRCENVALGLDLPQLRLGRLHWASRGSTKGSQEQLRQASRGSWQLRGAIHHTRRARATPTWQRDCRGVVVCDPYLGAAPS